MRHATTEHLLAALRSGIVTVNFTKIDGTNRTDRFTLSPDHVPAEQVKPSQLRNNTSDNWLVSAWDLTTEGWRSFLMERVSWWEPEVKVDA